MSVDAYAIFRACRYDALGIGDAQVVHCNDPAAELHGYADASKLVGRFLSDLQDPEIREVGRRNYALAQHGKPYYHECATVVRAPDGEPLGQCRELMWRLADVHGEETYMVRVSKVRELDTPTLPRIDDFGLTPADVDEACGQFTVRQVREMISHGTIGLQISPTFLNILDECAIIARDIFHQPQEKALDIALSDQCTWSLDEKTDHPVVYLAAACQECGRKWWRKNVRARRYRCPSCKAYGRVG